MPKHSKGFTLLEITVVTAILGVLSVMVIGSYKATMIKRNDLKRKSDLSQLGKALELYYQDNGRYPGAVNGQMNACTPDGVTLCAWGQSMMGNTNLDPDVIYIAKLPQDTHTNRTYYYMTDLAGSYYKLFARLENKDDQDTHATDYTDPTGNDCDPDVHIGCNFAVSSTNVVVQ